jgi:superfamily II DNA/RNA helicase
MDLINRKAADLSKVHSHVIDEADRMADMGFLPQVQWILHYVPKERQTMLFSATLDQQIMGLIAQTKNAVRHEIADKEPTVESMEHHLFEVHHLDKVDVLVSLLNAPRELTLVFTRTKRGCDKLAKSLRDAGIKAAAIHGDLRQGQREQALERFEKGKVDVLVATDVAARGLDISGITQVVNYDPPEDHKAYLHRVGRTARAGRKGVGITLALYDQREDVERIARRLKLNPHIVEVFSSDPRLAKVGTSEMPGAARVEQAEGDTLVKTKSALAQASRRASTRRRRGPGR